MVGIQVNNARLAFVKEGTLLYIIHIVDCKSRSLVTLLHVPLIGCTSRSLTSAPSL